MPDVQDLTRYLGALAASDKGEIIHYIHQTNGSLVEKKFDKEWSLPTIVGPAKIGTSAAYAFRGSQRIVVALNEVNILQDYEYSEDDGEWTPGNLAVLKLTAYPDTKLAIATNGEVFHVYFQNTSGVIQEIVSDGAGAWNSPSNLSVAKPVLETSISAMAVAGVVHVWYAHQDRAVHKAVYKNGVWSDSAIDTIAPPTRIVAVSLEHIYYTTETGDIILIGKDGTGTKFGSIGADGSVSIIGGEECFGIFVSVQIGCVIV